MAIGTGGLVFDPGEVVRFVSSTDTVNVRDSTANVSIVQTPAQTGDYTIPSNALRNFSYQNLGATSATITARCPAFIPEVVPTLSQWAAILLALSLAGLGGFEIQHRRRPEPLG